jgi:succinoglycan biosynthesis transport protein ExoP
MDLSQFLLALRARRKAFMLVLAATVVAAMAVALIVPKRYVSTASILIDARDEQSMTSSRMSPRERAGYIHTQVDLLQSGRVAARVARDLKLAQRPGVREAFESDTGGTGSIDDWVGANLLEKLKVDTSASNVITVTYSSSDPRYAAEVANGFVNAYMRTALDLRTEPTREAAEWFEEQLKGLRTEVSQAQTKLAGYQKAKGITFPDERADMESARLSELTTQLLAARNATYDAMTRHRAAAELHAAGNVSEIPEVLSNAYVNTIKADLSRAEARLDEQAQVLGPEHPLYKRTVGEVQGLRDKLGAETKKVVQGLGNSAEQSRRREKQLEEALALQQQKVLSMKDVRVEMAVMTRDVENAQRSYDTALARHVSNKVDSKARTTNVAVLTPGLEPVRPAHPKVGLIGALSVIIGTLLAAAVVYLLEMADRRVRSRSDLESRLAVPTLGRLSKWQPTGGRLLPVPQLAGGRSARALPNPSW